MSSGSIYPSEITSFKDARTGKHIRRLTDHDSIHHHPFFYVPAYTGDGSRIVFVSHRSGRPEIYTVDTYSGEIMQITERPGIGEWSVHPAWNCPFVLYTAGQAGYCVDLETMQETQVADFRFAQGMRDHGMVGAAMGVTALSWCDRYWAVRVNQDNGAALLVTDLETGIVEKVLERDEIGHLSFCPDDSSLLFAAGSLQDRVWVVNRDGTNDRRLYARQSGEWITHETWIPGTRELAFVDWPHSVRAVHADTGAVRTLASFNAWHAATNRQGTAMVADTNFPDIGLQLFSLGEDAGNTLRTLCYPGASSVGAHWAGPFPYNNGPIEVYAPQHTHAHPSFSPNGTKVVFTSDRSGQAQIYEVDLADSGQAAVGERISEKWNH